MPTGKRSAVVLVEPGYDKHIDCDYCLRGIRETAANKEISVKIYVPFDPTEGYPDKLPPCVILLSATDSWASNVSAELHRRGIEVIQMPCTQSVGDPLNHTIGENYLGYTKEILCYLAAGGRRRIAMIGFNDSVLDKRRIRGFVRAKDQLGGKVTFELLAPDTDYADIPGNFDTVIVNNGINAAAFVMWANENGVRIPQELWVLSMQSTQITRILSPSITTVKALDYFHLGELALDLVLMLSSANVRGQIYLRHDYELIVRESTANFRPSDIIKPTSNRLTNQKWSQNNDSRTSLCCEIENKLFCLDDIDINILRHILLRTTTERIAELENMSNSTVNHHIKSILALFHVDSRQALIRLFYNNHLLGIPDTTK